MLRVLLALVLASSIADASPLRVEISGDACDLGRLEAKTIELAPDATFRADAPTRLSIATRATKGGVAARITHDGGREVRVATCDELVDSLALILAMASRTAAERPATDEEHPLTPAIVERDEDAVPSPPASSLWSVYAGGAGSRTSEHWITRAVAGVRWRRNAGSLGVEARASSPTDDYLDEATKIRVWDATLALVPCLHLRGLAVCGSVAAGFIRGTSTNLADARDRTSPSMSLGARLEWTLPVWGPLGVRVHLDADAYLTTTRFDVDHMARWGHDRVEVRGGFGAIAHFP